MYSKLIYNFKAIPIQINYKIFVGNDKLILTSEEIRQKNWNSQTNSEKKKIEDSYFYIKSYHDS